jgi:hypothetical protein
MTMPTPAVIGLDYSTKSIIYKTYETLEITSIKLFQKVVAF